MKMDLLHNDRTLFVRGLPFWQTGAPSAPRFDFLGRLRFRLTSAGLNSELHECHRGLSQVRLDPLVNEQLSRSRTGWMLAAQTWLALAVSAKLSPPSRSGNPGKLGDNYRTQVFVPASSLMFTSAKCLAFSEAWPQRPAWFNKAKISQTGPKQTSVSADQGCTCRITEALVGSHLWRSSCCLKDFIIWWRAFLMLTCRETIFSGLVSYWGLH